MSATPTLETAFDMLARCVEEGLVPGAAAAVGTVTATLHRACYGYAELAPQRRSLADDALFDLASLTKVVATTTLALLYLERGQLFLNQRVATILPGFGATGKDEITLRHLLAHTSGLRAGPGIRQEEVSGPFGGSASSSRVTAGLGGRPEDVPRGASRPETIVDAVCRQPLDRPAGSAVVYGDLNYVALGAALAAVGGAPLDELARREIFEPLGMRDTQFCPPEPERSRCVATETIEARGGTIVSAVHDQMAAVMGGVAGHAGLFATCHDLERFCRMWLGMGQLDGRPFLSASSVAAATRDQTGLHEHRARRGLGWVLQPNPLWPAADLCSPRAYGHTGFTGTSMVIDPIAGIFAVLLTNRVHPTREGTADKIAAVRARFHNAVWAALSR